MHTLYTIGHSTRSIEDFLELLTSHEIELLVDIRTIPKSRHNPQFGHIELEKSLKSTGIEYTYLKALGGLRPATKPSTNTAWRNKSFRNYADYMQTPEFVSGLEILIDFATKQKVAIMCAEAVPWRCHRNLVSDALVARNIPVCEIIGKKNARTHHLTTFAVVDGTKVTYPASALIDEEKTDK